MEKEKAQRKSPAFKIVIARVVMAVAMRWLKLQIFTLKSACIRNLERTVILSKRTKCTYSSYFILKPFFFCSCGPFFYVFLLMPLVVPLSPSISPLVCVCVCVRFVPIVLFTDFRFDAQHAFYSILFIECTHSLLTFSFCLHDEYTSP